MEEKKVIEGLIHIKDISNSRISARNSEYEYITIKKNQLDEYIKDGWEFSRKNKQSYRLKKPKSHDIAFEDRVWALFAKMRFDYLNADRNFKIKHSKDLSIPGKQIDVFAADNETAVIIECKSAEVRKKDSFSKDIAEIGYIRRGITNTIKKHFNSKPKIAWIFATNKIIMNDNDKARLKENNVIYFNQDDINYYEQLVYHLGSVAKYQLFGRLFKDKEIPELSNKVPAIRGKMGGYTYYSFSIEPEVLLKIGFVLHRTDSSKEAFDSYQRMLKRKRIKDIGEFINNGGYFPNSIIINISTGKKNEPLQFDKATSTEYSSQSVLGVLHLPKKYHSAFIIDGQHRLFGYGNSEWKSKNTIPVVAFEDLPAKDQTELFVKINHEQKSVAKNLLRTLMSEFNWGSDSPDEAFEALKTKLIHRLNNSDDSALYRRIIIGEEKKSEIRCLTLEYLIRYGLNKTNFFGVIQKKKLIKTGYLWAGDYASTLKKSFDFINLCLIHIEVGTKEHWDRGSAPGGFITMNNGIATSIRIIDNILDFLTKSNGLEPEKLTPKEIYQKVKPFLNPVINFINLSDIEEIKKLRSYFGAGAVDKILREFQYVIQNDFEEFNPEGLEQWIKDFTSNYNTPAKELGDEIQLKIRDHVFENLKEEYGKKNWWKEGIPKEIQKYCADSEIDEGYTDNKENYLLTLHYQSIIKNNKIILINYYTPPDKGSASIDKKLSWFVQFNSIRKKYSHPEREKVTEEELTFLTELKDWLMKKLEAKFTS
jgi:DNA sulfur modification protein DndB